MSLRHILTAIFCCTLSALTAAELTFEEPLKEVDAPADAKTVIIEFPFANKSDEIIEITRQDAPCSCLSAQISGGKLIYKPGESGIIKGIFKLGTFSGTVDKSIYLWKKGDPAHKASMTITARINIPEIVQLTPRTLLWELGKEATSKTIDITINNPEPIKITKVDTTSDNFQLDLKTIEAGKKYQLAITPKDSSKPGFASIKIHSDAKIPRFQRLQAFCTIKAAK
ncbi:DUF1573 domain-containing protein [Persicirhabdus sediminis]|uniref:DUF1573 domain-containing protein n=1 Tax=Persicirhabdus sediminis TaxID=454144 RepID=A0A8J7SMW8_9BACT|nr:DUF1573 domain-containing protein [Persicirhabdus sediminis]MBK1792340.1 DUF1573 domain-containing protein [Persicirhabdus sediminis]